MTTPERPKPGPVPVAAVPSFPNQRNKLLAHNLNHLNATFAAKPAAEKSNISTSISSLHSLLIQLTQVNNNFRIWEEVVQPPKTIEAADVAYYAEYSDKIDPLLNSIPEEIRHILWLSILKTLKTAADYYLMNKEKPLIHDRQIKKDITRSLFSDQLVTQNKLTVLQQHLKVYSTLDLEIGYNQSMIFVIAPLVLTLNELDSFSLGYTLLNDYNLKSFYDPDMKGFTFMVYKFEQCLSKRLPHLFNHLSRNGIVATMYCSQWFLTVFSYKLPLEQVLKVYDRVIFEGLDFLIKFALNVMKTNEKNLLALSADQLLVYLKHDMFIDVSFQNYENIDMQELHIYEVEMQEIYDAHKRAANEVSEILSDNGNKRARKKELQSKLAVLNAQHLRVVEELISKKVYLQLMQQSNFDYQQEIEKYQHELSEIGDTEVPEILESEIEELLEKNREQVELNMQLEERVEVLAVEADKYKRGWFR